MKTTTLLLCALIVVSSHFYEISSIKGYEDYLQDDVADINYFSASSCYRPCIEGAPPMVCHYRWVLEDYKTLGPSCGNCPANISDCFRPHCITADGYERGVLSVNRKLPGPSIQVCLGDRIVVDVENQMPGRSTTIHWHGIFQERTPYMDGVPMVTQCPIPAMATFRYDYWADNAGTFFWHSHDGMQKLDGLQGSVVVREPRKRDPNAELYDFDLSSHVITLMDWMHLSGDEHFPGLVTHDKFQEPDTLLFDGKGRYNKNGTLTDTPYAVYRVTSGKKYRFRLVGALCTSCPVQISIEQHKMLLVAVDGNAVKPVPIDSIVIYSGERYDFVLEADQEVRTYWIHARTIGNCESFFVYQLAILRYNGANKKIPPTPDPGPLGFPVHKILNPFNANCRAGLNICVDQLELSDPVSEEILAPRPDFTLIIPFDFHIYNAQDLSIPERFVRYFQPRNEFLLSSTMNNISYMEPSSPLISQWRDIPPDSICPLGSDNLPTCPINSESVPCTCTQIIPVPLNVVLEVALVDRGIMGLNHPFHLHGYAFHVMAMGQFKPGERIEDVIRRVHSGELRPSPAPHLTDTVAVPSQGYTIFRVFTNNPGFWFFHCHFVAHVHSGMALVLQVGRDADITKPPKGFPKCENTEEVLQCRICQTDKQERLISPCYCKGTIGYMHRSCLERWLESSARLRCELCHYPYRVITMRRYKRFASIFYWFRYQADLVHVLFDVLSLVVLTPLFSFTIYVCIHAVEMNDQKHRSRGSTTRFTLPYMLVVCITIFLGYCVWVYAIFRQFYNDWFKWWSTCRRVQVLFSEKPPEHPEPNDSSYFDDFFDLAISFPEEGATQDETAPQSFVVNGNFSQAESANERSQEDAVNGSVPKAQTDNETSQSSPVNGNVTQAQSDNETSQGFAVNGKLMKAGNDSETSDNSAVNENVLEAQTDNDTSNSSAVNGNVPEAKTDNETSHTSAVSGNVMEAQKGDEVPHTSAANEDIS